MGEFVFVLTNAARQARLIAEKIFGLWNGR
jgi:hypothetical protein